VQRHFQLHGDEYDEFHLGGSRSRRKGGGGDSSPRHPVIDQFHGHGCVKIHFFPSLLSCLVIVGLLFFFSSFVYLLVLFSSLDFMYWFYFQV
jgi:hypothetical protein